MELGPPRIHMGACSFGRQPRPFVDGDVRSPSRRSVWQYCLQLRVWFRAYQSGLSECIVSWSSGSTENRNMDSERRIEKWNAKWMIVAGREVCIDCLESQALEDCESAFRHARACETSDGKPDHPWIGLHDILDFARGLVTAGQVPYAAVETVFNPFRLALGFKSDRRDSF